METSLAIAVRSSGGVDVHLGPPSYKHLDDFSSVSSKSCRAMLFSPDGQYFTYVVNQSLHIVRTSTWHDIAVLEGTKAYHLAFSPKGTYLMSWEPFTVSNDNPQGQPNLNIYKTDEGKLVKSFIQKKQANWEPQWSADELLVARLINTDVVFYEDANFENIKHRINAHKVSSFSLSPTSGPYFLLCHTPGAPGQPSFGRLFKYPNFDAQQIVASKSFFQADKVEVHWNAKGTSALLLTMTEVDKTGGSYYGKQSLHFIATNGQTAMVTLSKEGPIYSIAWSPKNQEFCVTYGFMPSRTTIFNLKCEPVFELGAGPRNSIYYNPHGNILLLGGFGNLRGQVELWNINSKKIIGKCDAPDTTLLQWAPDGVHFLTATTAPRLRIGNGFKIWHHSGTLLHENPWSQSNELYEACWQNFPKNTFKEPTITTEKIEGIASSQPQASKEAYRPPSARNKPVVQFKLHDEDEPAWGEPVVSKAALKQRKKRENRKARKQDENEDIAEPLPKGKTSPVASVVPVSLTGDVEKDKKIKNVKKKLDSIVKLKEQQAQGKTLEVNQLAKIKGEGELLRELQQLQL